MALAVSGGLFFTGAPAVHASSKGRLNTTYALGAATIYSLLKHKTTQGVILGLGTAYAYKRYQDSVNSRHRWERAAYYYHRSYPYRSYSYRHHRYHHYRHHYYRR